MVPDPMSQGPISYVICHHRRTIALCRAVRRETIDRVCYHMSHQGVHFFRLTGNNRRATTRPTGTFPVGLSHLTPPAGYHIGEVKQHTEHAEVAGGRAASNGIGSVRRAMFRSWMFYNPAQSDARADSHGHLMSCIHIQLTIERLKLTHQARSTDSIAA